MHGLASKQRALGVPALFRSGIGSTLLVLALLVTLSGCSREHFRKRADKDVAAVISQKNIFPDWKVENWHVYPDPRARFADPSNPDHPPYPPDDPAAWMLSPNPQKPHKKWGSHRNEGTEYLRIIEQWDSQNRAEDEANPDFKEQRNQDKKVLGDSELAPITPVSYYEPVKEQAPEKEKTDKTDKADKPKSEKEKALSMRSPSEDAMAAVTGGFAVFERVFKSEEKTFRLRLEQAVELGLFNSREFQDRREDVYLAALPVTAQRFSFAAQALATEGIIQETLGRERPGGPSNRWTINTGLAVNRLFPTGATLLANFANQVVVDFSAGRPDISLSNFTLTFIQPLLRGGGYAVTLENLTAAERNLLYALRSFARFRKMYYVVIAGNGDYTNNPYGLQGLSVNLGRAIGNNLTAPTAGYLPVVLRSANLANERRNIANLEQMVRLYQNLKEGGVVSDLQAVRVELSLLQSQARWLDSRRQLLDNLDIFKLQLGLPMNFPLELDEGPVNPIRKQLQRFDELYLQIAAFQGIAGKYNPAETVPQIRTRWTKLLTESPFSKGTPFSKELPQKLDALTKLSQEALEKRIREAGEIRQKMLDDRAERQLAGKPETDQEVSQLSAIESEIELLRFEAAIRNYETKPWLRYIPDRRPGEQMNAYRPIVDFGLLVALQARNQRLQEIRDTWPKLPPVMVQGSDILAVPLDEGYTKCSQIALMQRLDLLNARAQVVDAYRQIAVNANALLGQFDVRYDYNTASPANTNLTTSLGGSRSRNAVTLNISPPFVRRVERNAYRATLISFQRQRRTLMAFEDNILYDIRVGIRQLRSFAEQYNVQKRSIELAYSQLDNARATLLAPPDPRVQDTAVTAAALTEQLLNAQQNLLTAQNSLYTAWVNFLTTRMGLFLDLEQLPLDARGLWIDDQERTSPVNIEQPASGGDPERIPAPRAREDVK